jgi:TM2 domain-containing membrane protein YozV
MQVIDEKGNTVPSESSKRVAAGILAILLGQFGIHKFILGYTREGIILLGLTFLSYLLMCLIIGAFLIFIPIIIGLIEGVIYLTKTDEEFVYMYQTNKKSWF